MIDILKQEWRYIKDWIHDMRRDIKRITSASMAVGALIILSQLALGLLPVYELSMVGKLIEALTGARAIKVWSPAIGPLIWNQILIVALLIPAIHFTTSLNGLAESIAKRLRHAAFAVSIVLFGLAGSPIQFIFIILFAWLAERIPHRPIRILLGACIFLAMVHALFIQSHRVVQSITSIDQFILWAGAIMFFTAWILLHITTKKRQRIFNIFHK